VGQADETTVFGKWASFMGQHDLLYRFQLNSNHTYMVSWSLIRNWSQHYVASFV